MQWIVVAVVLAVLVLSPWLAVDTRDGLDWQPGTRVGGPLSTRWFRLPRRRRC